MANVERILNTALEISTQINALIQNLFMLHKISDIAAGQYDTRRIKMICESDVGGLIDLRNELVRIDHLTQTKRRKDPRIFTMENMFDVIIK